MASFPLNRKTSYHARSISLPARSHPLTLKVEEQLYRLRSFEATSSSVSLLKGLKDLHDCVEGMLQLPLTQQVLIKERSHKCIDEVLNGSLLMLDVCTTTRDILSQSKECKQELRSSLRRRRGGEIGIANEIGLYLKSRKEVLKEMHKCFIDLKRLENKRVFSSLLDKDHNLVAIIGMIREVEALTLSMFQSLFLSVFSSARSNQRGWSFVSKLMNNNKRAQGEETNISEWEKFDVALSSLVSNKSCKGDIQNVQKQLEELELIIQGFDYGLECVYQSLIKTRVTLLNILSQ